MTINYPLSIPATYRPRNVTWTSANAVSVSRSEFTYQSQRQRHSGSSWAIEVSYPPMTPEVARDLLGLLVSLGGQYGSFMFSDPLLGTPAGVWGASPQVRASGGTGYTLYVKGLPPSQAGAARRGDFIQVGQRLYMVTGDADADGLGNANIDIWPTLREIPAEHTPIITTSPQGIFQLASNLTTFGSDEEKLFNVAFSAVEAL